MAMAGKVDPVVEHIVLFSGGYESTGCLVRALQEAGGDTRKVSAIFFEYGQPYLKQERAAVKSILDRLGMTLFVVGLGLGSYEDKGKGIRVFDHRNQSFLVQAHFFEPSAKVWFGCRAPWKFVDAYGDSNRQFANEISKKYGFKIVTPFIWYPKFMVRAVAEKAGLDQFVFSSENYKYE